MHAMSFLHVWTLLYFSFHEYRKVKVFVIALLIILSYSHQKSELDYLIERQFDIKILRTNYDIKKEQKLSMAVELERSLPKDRRILQKLLDPTIPRQGLNAFTFIFDDKKEFRGHCDTCAIVSSSGNLINSSAGVEIDSHQCVFRMNHHASLNYERDVGNKTTYRFGSSRNP